MDLELQSGSDDLKITDGNLSLVDGTASIIQHLRIRLRFFLGEWFLDERIGIPYFERVLKKNPNRAVVIATIRKVIISTPGVTAITDFDLSIDTATRIGQVSFKATTDAGDIEYSQELVI